MSIANYNVEVLNETTYKIFKGVYNDFVSKAISEYKFELNPLAFDEFIEAVKNNYLKCIVLKENEIPTAFLVYTTMISESIELNIIHCLGTEDKTTKYKMLLEKFLDETVIERENKVVAYPMIGQQSTLTSEFAKYGFKFVGQVVLRFIMGNASSERTLENMKLSEKSDKYKIVSYNDEYRQDAIRIIHESFKDAQDSLFDTRYKTIEGTSDIINKIVENIYGEFLPEATSVLLHNEKPCGFVFANITGNTIGNIPLVAIESNHRGHKLSELLLNRTVKIILDWTKLNKKTFSEINVTTETSNYKALKMYRKVGFRESFCYPQAYLLANKK